MTSKSKKFLKVIDGLRAFNLTASSSTSIQKSGIDVKEILKSDHFQFGNIAKHGFPYQPTCLAFDPVQRILAVGTNKGYIKLFGTPGVEFLLSHSSSAAVLQLIFLINEGGLISICQDDVVHLWNVRQKPPDIVHSLHFKRETLTCGYLAVSSSWLSVGSEQGNVHFVNVQQFVTSGYVINWNKAIDLSQSQRPGAVIQLSENPVDWNKLLVGYSSGLLVLWDLRAKSAEVRFQYHEPLHSFAWHWDGKSLISAHNSGTLVTWIVSQPRRPQSVICPHAGDNDISSSQFSYEAIRFVQWLPMKNAEPIVIFTGGSRLDTAASTPSITIMRGKRLAVMQMDFEVVAFTSLCSSPYFNELCEPYAVAVLLQQDFVLVDLLSPGFPSFENPYPMDISVSPVTSCCYVVDCPPDLVPAFYAVGSRGKRAAAPSRSTNHERGTDSGGGPPSATPDSFSSKKWPINGGEWGTNLCSYQEIIITGHADGSVRFWDASGVTLTPLYKVRTGRYFDRLTKTVCSSQSSRGDLYDPSTTTVTAPDKPFKESPDQLLANAIAKPLAIRFIRFCVDSRTLLLAGQRHLCLLSFCRSESAFEIPVLDVYLHYEEDLCVDPSLSITDETSSILSSASGRRGIPQHPCNPVTRSTSSAQPYGDREKRVSVAVRAGVRQWSSGYQPSLVCRLGAPSLRLFPSDNADVLEPLYSPNPPPITAISLTSATNLFAFGTEGGIAVVDYYQGICLVCVGVLEIEALDHINRPRMKSSSRFPSSGCGSKLNTSNQPSGSTQRSVPTEPPSPTRALFRQWFQGSTGGGTIRRAHLCHTVSLDSCRLQQGCDWPSRFLSPDVQIVDFRGRKGTKAKITSNATPGLIFWAASPLTASNKYADSASQPHSDFSEQSSIDQSVLEGIRWLTFVDLCDRKTEPTLWIGTSRGSVFGFTLNLSDDRSPQTSIYSLYGSLFKFDGEVVYIGFGDAHGELCGSPSVKWEAGGSWMPRLTLVPHATEEVEGSSAGRSGGGHVDDGGDCSTTNSGGENASSSTALWRLGTNKTPPASRRMIGRRNVSSNSGSLMTHGSANAESVATSGTSNSNEEAPSSSGSNHTSTDSTDRHFMVVVSEKHAQVIGLPSRNCYNRVKITETSSVMRAELANQRMSPSYASSTGLLSTSSSSSSAPSSSLFVSCLLSNGHLLTFSLPSLRILSDIDVVSEHFRQALFTFGNLGHAVYMFSPSELAKVSMSADLTNNLNEMHGELFLPCNMPDPPKRNFFSNFFSGSGLSSADKDTLFGEQQAGKSACGTTALLPSTRVDRLTGQASGASSEIARARNAAIERGEKLGQLEVQAQEMADQSKAFGRTAALLASKYEKHDKWWGVWPQ